SRACDVPGPPPTELLGDEGKVKKKQRAGLLIAVAAALLLGGGGYYAWSDSSGPTVAERAAEVDLRLPLDDYRLSYTQQAAADRAQHLLARACMEKAGYSWYVSAEPSAGLDPSRLRYGVIDPRIAQRFGYHLPTNPATSDTYRRRAAILKSPGASEAYFGPGDANTKGCAGKALARLRQGAEEFDESLAAALSAQAAKSSVAQRDVVNAQRRWKECMAKRGHVYATPGKAAQDKAWDLNSPKVTARERAVALADVECKYEVDLIHVRLESEKPIHQKKINDNARLLKAQEQARETYLKNVRDVLRREPR
ncbi:hypothetical protein ACFU76_16465, partial [Streptomyces sp. NPDC057539]|uniref:hypothetical protein n=1 Tax=Streptomyces sp. NPDC057539 TaxID=3346159 RepID=UPI0036B3EB09